MLDSPPPDFICLFLFCAVLSPGTHCIDQAGLELSDPPTDCLLSAGIKGIHHHYGSKI